VCYVNGKDLPDNHERGCPAPLFQEDPMREVTIGTHRYTQVICLDEPGAGGACHVYAVRPTPPAGICVAPDFATVSFQNGPMQEAAVNGCHNEDLIAIVIDRLQGFQSGEYKCRENAIAITKLEIAITKLEEAMLWLNKRTSDRQKRGVEGTHVI